MKKHIRWMVLLAWIPVVIWVLAPMTALWMNSFLTVAGTVFLMKATSHYLYYGTEGLKFWRWNHQRHPRDLSRE